MVGNIATITPFSTNTSKLAKLYGNNLNVEFSTTESDNKTESDSLSGRAGDAKFRLTSYGKGFTISTDKAHISFDKNGKIKSCTTPDEKNYPIFWKPSEERSIDTFI